MLHPGLPSCQSPWPLQTTPALAADAGLPNALALLTPIKEQYPELGWADLIQVRGGALCLLVV